MNTQRVLITGLGSVSGAGCGREALERQIAKARLLLAEVDRSSGLHEERDGSRRAALVEQTNFMPWLSPMAARRMSRPSRFAVAAARLALEDAALELDEAERATAAVGLATSFGPTDFSERIIKSIYDSGPESASPALFTESVANAPAAQVALALQILGPNIMVTQREAGPLIAVASIAREVASGRSSVGLAGGVDEVNPLLHAVLDRFGALAVPDESGDEAARPFDRRRAGFNVAEGASVVVLESEERARRRGARPLATLRLAVSGFDPESPVAGWSSAPDTLARRLRKEFEREGLGVRDVDRIVSGASGSRRGDRLEGLVLRSVFGEGDLPPIQAPKGVVGEYGGGHLAAAILAAAGRRFGPTAGFEEVDPEIGIVPHDGRDLEPPRVVLVSALAAGGAAAWLVLEAEET